VTLTPADARALAALLRAVARPRTPAEADAIAAWMAVLDPTPSPEERR
jgi:hypothetical protein